MTNFWMICNIRIILDSIFISVTLWIQMSYLLPIMIPWKIYFFANYLWHKSPFKRNYKTANEKLGNQKSLPIFFFLRIKMKRRGEGEGFLLMNAQIFSFLKQTEWMKEEGEENLVNYSNLSNLFPLSSILMSSYYSSLLSRILRWKFWD